MLAFFCIILSIPAALSAMEGSASSAAAPAKHLLECTDNSEKAILKMVEESLLLEYGVPERSAIVPSNCMATRLRQIVMSHCNPDARRRISRIIRLMLIEPTTPFFIHEDDAILPSSTLNDLDVLVGSTERAHSLAHAINKTKTDIGYITLCRHLVQTKQPDALKELQNTVEQLKSIQKEVCNLLSEIAQEEDTFLSFWTNTDPRTTDSLNDSFEHQKITVLPGINNWANHNPTVCRIHQVGMFATPFIPLITSTATLAVGLKTKNNLMIASGALFTATAVARLPKTYKNLKCNAASLALMHMKLRSLRTFMTKIDELRSLLIKHKFPDALTNALKFSDDKNIVQLKKLLDNRTFKKSSTMLANWGKISVGFRFMMENRDKLISTYKALGTIDFIASLAELSATSNTNKPFCVAKFASDASDPAIIITDGWTPLINAQSIVKNSIILGGDVPHSIVITGPNARGKTTILRTAACNVLLGSTLGYCTAQCVSMPSNISILTSINIHDTPGKESLFQAGVKQITAVMHTAQAYPNRPCLVILDEPFTGTRRENAEAIAEIYIRAIASCSNALTLLTSHLSNVVDLENSDPASFANFYVAEGFKFVPGIDPNEDYNDVALAIISEAVTDEEFVNKIRTAFAANNKKDDYEASDESSDESSSSHSEDISMRYEDFSPAAAAAAPAAPSLAAAALHPSNKARATDFKK